MPYLSDGNYANLYSLPGGSGAYVQPSPIALPQPKPGYYYSINTIVVNVSTSRAMGQVDFSVIDSTGNVTSKYSDTNTSSVLHTATFSPYSPILILPGDNWAVQLGINDTASPPSPISGTVGMQSLITNGGWSISGTGTELSIINGANPANYLYVAVAAPLSFHPQDFPIPDNQGLSVISTHIDVYNNPSNSNLKVIVQGNTVINTPMPANSAWTGYDYSYTYPQPLYPSPKGTDIVMQMTGGTAAYTRTCYMTASYTSGVPAGSNIFNAGVSIRIDGSYGKWI